VAPEYGCDDYKGVDAKGRFIVMLINDPAVADPKDATKLDATMFKGNAMTYYGHWTYEYYAENPLVPLEKTLANINMDGFNQWGRTAE